MSATLKLLSSFLLGWVILGIKKQERLYILRQQLLLALLLMKMLVSAYSSLAITGLTLLSRIVSAQLILPQAQHPYDNQQEDLDQIPIEVGFGWHEPKMDGIQPNGPPLLSDILGIDRSLSIFAGLGRSIESIATRLADESVNSTLLAPRNSALQTLPRKPWEDKSDDEQVAKHGSKDLLWSKEAEDKARKNVEDFVAAHVVTKYPIQEGEDLPTLNGSPVSYKVKGGEKYILPGNIKVLGEREAANGAIWVLDGVIE